VEQGNSHSFKAAKIHIFCGKQNEL
jgi:hypothetical protein